MNKLDKLDKLTELIKPTPYSFKDHKLTLEFSINGEPRSVTVKSSRDLNSGEWQQVWIDYNEYHVRFTVNQESILVDLNDGEEFGPFEATLFIGGAPE